MCVFPSPMRNPPHVRLSLVSSELYRSLSPTRIPVASIELGRLRVSPSSATSPLCLCLISVACTDQFPSHAHMSLVEAGPVVALVFSAACASQPSLCL